MKTRHVATLSALCALVALMLMLAPGFAQDAGPGALGQALRQNGGVGGSSFDPTAATNLTFTTGNGAIAGTAGTDLTVASASGRKVTVTATGANLELTGGNQILMNSAGHYIRQGLGTLNLPSDGGLAFCTDTTASTIGGNLTFSRADYGSGNTYNYLLEGPQDDANHTWTNLTIGTWVDRTLGNRYLCSITSKNDGRVELGAIAQGPYVGTSSLYLYASSCALLFNGSANTFDFNQRINSAGPLVFTGAGNGIKLKEGANAVMGVATLVAGEKVVTTTAVTASSRVMLTSQVDGGTPGWLRVSTRTAATSFTITSSSGTDTSDVAWVILEPSP